MAPDPQGGGVGQVVRLDPLLRVRVPRLCKINNKVRWVAVRRSEFESRLGIPWRFRPLSLQIYKYLEKGLSECYERMIV